MPEMQFQVRWPNATETSHYSPSLVIEEHLSPGQSYELTDFLQRSSTALGIASERVRVRYGTPCGRALAERNSIERHGRCFEGGQVTVLAFHRPDHEAPR